MNFEICVDEQSVVNAIPSESVKFRKRPLLMAAGLVLLDAITLAACLGLALLLFANAGTASLTLRAGFAPLITLSLFSFVVAGLYPGVALSPPEEIRKCTLAAFTVCVCLVSGSMLLPLPTHPIQALVVYNALISVGIPLARAMGRAFLAKRGWWGHPAVVFGADETARAFVRLARKHPSIGLCPVALLDFNSSEEDEYMDLPILRGIHHANVLAEEYQTSYAVLAAPALSRQEVLDCMEKHGQQFSHFVVIPDLMGLSSLWSCTKDLGGVLGIEIKQRLLLPEMRMAKRAFDLLVALSILALLAPLFALIGGLVKIDSPGPVFFGHKRIGRRGRAFKAWKFRTMVPDAEAALTRYLRDHPEYREEWEKDFKLKHDPRVTRIGRFLRKTSLDELPQLWNVIWGEMSLVGPRPIVQSEAVRYGESLRLYERVYGGITGLWQVSGRNDIDYNERIALDNFYVRNWSVWLDLYILARTVRVVLKGHGAY